MFTLPMSNATGCPVDCLRSSAFFSGAFLSLASAGCGSIRSLKLKRPSFSLTIVAFRPDTRMPSTIAWPCRSGSSATDAWAESRARNCWSLPCSDSVTPLTLAPKAGQTATCRSPLRLSVRPVFSLTRRSISGLYRFGLNVMAKMTPPRTRRTTRPAIAYSVYLIAFIVQSVSWNKPGDLEIRHAHPHFDKMQEETVQPPQSENRAANSDAPLEQQLADAQAQVAAQREQMLRALADAENARKRYQADAASSQKFAIERFAA